MVGLGVGNSLPCRFDQTGDVLSINLLLWSSSLPSSVVDAAVLLGCERVIWETCFPVGKWIFLRTCVLHHLIVDAIAAQVAMDLCHRSGHLGLPGLYRIPSTTTDSPDIPFLFCQLNGAWCFRCCFIIGSFSHSTLRNVTTNMIFTVKHRKGELPNLGLNLSSLPVHWHSADRWLPWLYNTKEGRTYHSIQHEDSEAINRGIEVVELPADNHFHLL